MDKEEENLWVVSVARHSATRRGDLANHQATSDSSSTVALVFETNGTARDIAMADGIGYARVARASHANSAFKVARHSRCHAIKAFQ